MRNIMHLDEHALADELVKAGGVVRGRTVKCPFHDDKHASGSIYRGQDGIWRYKCQVPSCDFGGDMFDVRAKRMGVPLAEVLREVGQPKTYQPAPRAATIEEWETKGPGNHEATYRYCNPSTGEPELVVMRFRKPDGKKTFWQATPVGDGTFLLKSPDGLKPLYNRTRMKTATDIIVVEGEKCVHALAELGFVATTSPMGAGKADQADWTPVAGKTVYLWPDDDPPDAKDFRTGVEHMKQVQAILERLEPAPRIRWVNIDALDLPEKGDAADFVESISGMPGDEQQAAVRAVLSASVPVAAADDVWRRFDDIISGRQKVIGWPWFLTGWSSRALKPGTVTLICGAGGEGKSIWLSQAMAYWHDAGHKVATYDLEEARSHRLIRMLAQREENANILDDEWVKGHPDEIAEIFAKHADWLEGHGRTIYAAPDGPVPLDALAEWVETRCSAGAEIIAIDPVSVAEPKAKPWEADHQFIVRCKAAVRKSGACLILVMHPKKGYKGSTTLDDMAGGSAYPRLAHTVFWLRRLRSDNSGEVTTPMGTQVEPFNWCVKIVKARNGPGSGSNVAFRLRVDTLKFEEVGGILKEPKK